MKKTNGLKTMVFGLSLILFAAGVWAENGLENILVEKYYISNADDITATGGILHSGSITYRIYADMLPGYKFQAAYGIPGHELRIATSTSFFNSEGKSYTPYYSKADAKNNTIMLDSWLSVGAASKGNFGVLKSEDNGVETIVNANGLLQNDNPEAGIPVKTQDGFMAGSPEDVTIVGLSSADLSVFGSVNGAGKLFATSNGAWASLNGSVGPTAENRVLIAQVTTDVDFSFELNIQIGTPNHGVQNYVARNPVANEISIPSLIYTNRTSKNAVVTNKTSSVPSFSVYPNPTNGMFTLEVNTTRQSSNSYTIYDVNGNELVYKMLASGCENCLEHIDISSFAKGQYIIKLSLDGVISMEKIINN
jgi:hypothetical protein